MTTANPKLLDTVKDAFKNHKAELLILLCMSSLLSFFTTEHQNIASFLVSRLVWAPVHTAVFILLWHYLPKTFPLKSEDIRP